MIPANRGVCGIAFEEGEIQNDQEAINAAKELGCRIKELENLKFKVGSLQISAKLFLVPLISVGLFLLFIAIPKIDPLSTTLKSSGNTTTGLLF